MPRDGTELETLGPVEDGCAYIIDTKALCGAATERGRSYCAHHYALCHLPSGSSAERSRLEEIDIAAKFIGGRVYRGHSLAPPQRFMRSLDQKLRGK